MSGRLLPKVWGFNFDYTYTENFTQAIPSEYTISKAYRYLKKDTRVSWDNTRV